MKQQNVQCSKINIEFDFEFDMHRRVYQSFIETLKQKISIKIQNDEIFVSNIIEECLNDVDFNFDELRNSRRTIFRDDIVDRNVDQVIRHERIEILIIIDDFF